MREFTVYGISESDFTVEGIESHLRRNIGCCFDYDTPEGVQSVITEAVNKGVADEGQYVVYKVTVSFEKI